MNGHPRGHARPSGALPNIEAASPLDSRLLVSEREAARLLGVSPRTMFALGADPDSGINPTYIGRRKLYSRSQLEAWVNEHTAERGTQWPTP